MEQDTQDQLVQVLRTAMFAADNAVIGKDFPTPAARTRAAVEAAFKHALANKLITIVPAEEWPEYIALDFTHELPAWLK
jgi:hypothetical protein